MYADAKRATVSAGLDVYVSELGRYLSFFLFSVSWKKMVPYRVGLLRRSGDNMILFYFFT